jgi:hypothetical protein
MRIQTPSSADHQIASPNCILRLRITRERGVMPTRGTYSSTPQVRGPVRSIHVLHSGPRSCCVFSLPAMFTALPGDTHLTAVQLCCNSETRRNRRSECADLATGWTVRVRCQAGAGFTSLQYRLSLLRVWETSDSNLAVEIARCK